MSYGGSQLASKENKKFIIQRIIHNMTPRLKNSQRNCMTYLEKFPNVFQGQYTFLYIHPKIEEDVMSTLMQWERLHILTFKNYTSYVS